MIDAMAKAYIDQTMRPLFRHAIHIMGVRTLGELLIGYGISCVRGDGMTAEEIRSEIVEPALATV